MAGPPAPPPTGIHFTQALHGVRPANPAAFPEAHVWLARRHMSQRQYTRYDATLRMGALDAKSAEVVRAFNYSAEELARNNLERADHILSIQAVMPQSDAREILRKNTSAPGRFVLETNYREPMVIVPNDLLELKKLLGRLALENLAALVLARVPSGFTHLLLLFPAVPETLDLFASTRPSSKSVMLGFSYALGDLDEPYMPTDLLKQHIPVDIPPPKYLASPNDLATGGWEWEIIGSQLGLSDEMRATIQENPSYCLIAPDGRSRPSLASLESRSIFERFVAYLGCKPAALSSAQIIWVHYSCLDKMPFVHNLAQLKMSSARFFWFGQTVTGPEEHSTGMQRQPSLPKRCGEIFPSGGIISIDQTLLDDPKGVELFESIVAFLLAKSKQLKLWAKTDNEQAYDSLDFPWTLAMHPQIYRYLYEASLQSQKQNKRARAWSVILALEELGEDLGGWVWPDSDPVDFGHEVPSLNDPFEGIWELKSAASEPLQVSTRSFMEPPPIPDADDLLTSLVRIQTATLYTVRHTVLVTLRPELYKGVLFNDFARGAHAKSSETGGILVLNDASFQKL